MQTLRIHLFGQVRIFDAETAQPAKATHHVQALLAYLLLHRHRSHSREVLAGLLWGDHAQERARGSMNTTLWRLRRILEPDEALRGTFLHVPVAGEIAINPAGRFWLDVATFEDQSIGGLRQPVERMQPTDAERLEAAARLYTGELLEGFYEDWALRERQRLHQLYLSALAHLMQYHAFHHAYKESLRLGQQLLDQDPLREDIQREMIRLYLADGQRTRALQQYELCRRVLAAELGVPPLAETQALYVAILGGALATGGGATVGASLSLHHEEVLSTLRLALQTFDETRAHLQRVVELLEQMVNLLQIP